MQGWVVEHSIDHVVNSFTVDHEAEAKMNKLCRKRTDQMAANDEQCVPDKNNFQEAGLQAHDPAPMGERVVSHANNIIKFLLARLLLRHPRHRDFGNSVNTVRQNFRQPV